MRTNQKKEKLWQRVEVNKYAKLKRDRDALLETLEAITDKFPGDDGLEEAMKLGFDAELVAARCALAEAKEV